MSQTNLLPTILSPISPLIILCILFFSFVPKKSLDAVDPYFQICSLPQTCGDGQAIRFPFYIQDKQNSSCGYPGFNLSCNNNGHPTIVISNNNYIIHQIFYQTETLRVSDSAFSNPNSNCIPSINNISLPGARFDLVPNQTNLCLFYNCNSSVHGSLPSEFYPTCYGENDTVLALPRQDPKLISNVSMECKSSVLAPVKAYGGGGGIRIGESLRNGFVLKWKASNCSVCEDSGGYCGFDNIMYHFKCFCPDRPRVWNCTNTTRPVYLPEEEIYPPGCPPFVCGKVGKIGFPFANDTSPECGLLILNDCGDPHRPKTPKIKLEKNGTLQYDVKSISQANTIQIKDPQLQSALRCESLNNFTLPSFPFISFQQIKLNKTLTLFKCNRSLNIPPPTGFNRTNCSNYDIYYSPPHYNLTPTPPNCPIIQLPLNSQSKSDDLFKLLSVEIFLEVRVTGDCRECYIEGGQCKTDNEGKYYCTKGNIKRVLVIGLATGCSALLIFLAVGVAICVVYKKKHASQKLLSRTTYSDLSSKSDLEGGSVYFGIPVFSYTELEEATNNFDIEKELGDGGFGTVYHGKLHDGREVAVKRLYEHNYRRVEQFLNEVKILTRLHHKNLVSLYGCTSRHSRELLLVYEFVPNGTVADHIHGDRATRGSPKWATRLSIAVETASALAYLHASDIIHRDVKTDNILLDDNFCVKVADFGLSRLFPNDVTHVSTAPQGTPGYVDPEYHQCYQLTSKSDVYSFGVVLIELISSLPAVDMARHRHEINLANLAINKIEKCAFHELIDPHLGFELDNEVKRMTISVAELAFQCIQEDKEMRPSMHEVLEALKKIKSGNNDSEEKAYDDAGILNVQQTASPDCDEVGLLKTKQLPPPSPNDVTDNWTSRSTTPTVSG